MGEIITANFVKNDFGAGLTKLTVSGFHSCGG
jgi:hypothetical protein